LQPQSTAEMWQIPDKGVIRQGVSLA